MTRVNPRIIATAIAGKEAAASAMNVLAARLSPPALPWASVIVHPMKLPYRRLS
jgi:hypothetical protein